MQILSACDYEKAAALYADGFLNDPAFAFCLREQADPRAKLFEFFLNYLKSCKDLMLYTYDGQLSAVLCFYRWDKPPVETFDYHSSLERLEEFQHLESKFQTNYAVLDILAVRPDARGRGIAGEMIDFFLQYCKRNTLTPLVEIFAKDHLKMYLDRGFFVAFQTETHGVTTFVLEYSL